MANRTGRGYARKGDRLALKHGADSFAARGTAALSPREMATYEEIETAAHDHDGILAMLRHRAINAEMVARMMETYVGRELKRGVSPDEVKTMSRLATYQEAARRAWLALLDLTPDPVASYTMDDWLSGRVRHENGRIVDVPSERTEGGQDAD